MRAFVEIGHDLRTPLSVILGTSQVMEYTLKHKPGNAASFMPYIGIIRANVNRTLRLINNMLDLARMDSGGAQLNALRVDICRLLHDIAQSIEPFVKQRGITLRVMAETNVCVALDAVKMERALLNLLSNACKHTLPGGAIELCASVDESGAYFFVSDTGAGIERDSLDRLFKRYTTLNNRYDSTGLGLAVVKAIAELHGGCAAAESIVGCGSTFCIRLPKRDLSGLPVWHGDDALSEMAHLEMCDDSR